MRVRPLLHGSLAFVAGIALLETLSLGSGTMLFGRGFLARTREARARLSSAGLDAPGDAEVPSSLRPYVLHPYLGFVGDAEGTAGPVVNSKARLVPTELGFFRRRDAAAAKSADPIRIGIFGGSVAFQFGLWADDVLAEAVAASAAAAGREVVVETYALPGHKQPQQLFTLLYLLVLGRRLDVVVNLDGFNELALPVSENLAQGSAAIYPRSWSLLAATSASAALREAAADRSADAALRRMLARTFSAPVLRQSPTAALLWKLLDDALATRIADLDSAAGATLNDGIPAALRGPTSAVRPADDPLPELARLWRQSSLLMQQICRANGIAYVHALQPNQYVPDSKPLAPSELASAFRPDHPYRALVERGYPLLVEQGRVLAESGVRFVDLTMVFANERKPVYVDDCCHFGMRGRLLLAPPVAAAISAALAR
ncbi:hypothetical protein K2Z84_29115 [Candidatus Binatia bacterium]|nr:hypothetical protein [Candidatus Binatia bacterium]